MSPNVNISAPGEVGEERNCLLMSHVLLRARAYCEHHGARVLSWRQTCNLLRCPLLPVPRVRVGPPKEQKPHHVRVRLEAGNVQRGQTLAVLRADFSPAGDTAHHQQSDTPRGGLVHDGGSL